MKKEQDRDAMVRNMRDAGCDHREVECFCEYMAQKNRKEEILILEKHRELLLDEIHEIRHSIEELDRLLYKGENC